MMRNTVTKKSLRAAFAAPSTVGKRAFVCSLPRPRLSTAALIRQQLRWLGPRVWAPALLVLPAAVYGAQLFGADTLWILSALTPFLAVTLVIESGRASRCGMAELEIAAAFPLHSILLARMALLGSLHAALLGVLTAAAHAAPLPGAGMAGRLPWPRALAFLLLPYLLTAVLGLALCRRLSGDAVWPCLGAALAVAVGGPGLLRGAGLAAALYRLFPWALPLLLAMLAWQLRTALKQTEELPCN